MEYEIGDKVIFCPVNADEQPGEIIGLPETGLSKYKVRLDDGTEYPINACYLKPAE